MLLLLPAVLAAEPPNLERAVVAEVERAMAALRLPDAPPPYLCAIDVLDGTVTSAFAEGGAVVDRSRDPYRTSRVEVRVGDYAADSSNFFAFGEPEGIVSKPLPLEDAVLALRREIWLATDLSYKQAVEQLSRKRAARSGDPTPRPHDYSPAPSAVLPFADAPYPAAEEAWIVGLAERLSAAAGADPRVEIGQAIARDWQGRRLVVTSKGTRAWIPTGFTVVRVEGTARLADGSTLTDARWWVARAASLLPPEEEMLAATREMAAWLAGEHDAIAEEDYLGPVIFEAPAAVELFSQLLAAELAGSPPAEEDQGGMAELAAPPSARIGRRLLPAGWTVVDDPTRDARVAGVYPLDHEGVAPRRVELVQDGVLRDVLMSRIPRKDLSGSTGHGRALGGDRRAAMPGYVTVTPPRTVSQRKLERVALRMAAQTGRDYVLVVRRIVPPALAESVDVTFTGEGPPAGLAPPYEAYRLYADGRRMPVRSLSFVGVDRRVLKDVVLAGESPGPVDMLDGPPGPGRYQIGPTGGVPVTWDAPPVLIAEMELTARPGGEPRALSVPR